MAKKILAIVLMLLAEGSVVMAQPKKEKIAIPGSNVHIEMVFLDPGNLTKAGKELSLSGFWMSTCEVTFDAFSLFQLKGKDSNASSWKEGKYKVDGVTRPTPQYIDYTFGMGSAGGFPAVSMTQQGALRFCEWLYQKTGQFFRLPTEAEWEYACKAGDGYPGELDEKAWHQANSEDKYQKVGQKQPNAWGLYDMLGNVAEWTLDSYVEDYSAAIAEAKDPWIRPTAKHSRTVKGGSYSDSETDCSCEARVKSLARWQDRDPNLPKSIWWNTDAPFVGFRLVKPIAQPGAEEVKAFFQEAVKVE